MGLVFVFVRSVASLILGICIFTSFLPIVLPWTYGPISWPGADPLALRSWGLIQIQKVPCWEEGATLSSAFSKSSSGAGGIKPVPMGLGFCVFYRLSEWELLSDHLTPCPLYIWGNWGPGRYCVEHHTAWQWQAISLGRISISLQLLQNYIFRYHLYKTHPGTFLFFSHA